MSTVPSWSFKGNRPVADSIIVQSKKIRRTYVRTPPLTRFWAKVQKTEGCWNWLAACDEKGYGLFDSIRAHTWLAKNVLGWQPTHKLVVDHKCRNKRCVRPDHLRLVPQLVNMMNSDNPCPTALRAVQTHCSRGHSYEGDNLYVWGGHRYCRQCRHEYLKARRSTK